MAKDTTRLSILDDLMNDEEEHVAPEKRTRQAHDILGFKAIKDLLNEDDEVKSVKQEKPVKPSNESVAAKVNAFGMGAVEGVPIVGPLLRKGTNMLGAIPASIVSGKSYDESLKEVEQRTKEVLEANPKTALAGNVAGAIGGTVPAAMTKLGATALGMVGNSLAQRAGAGALSGAVIGAADSAARGQNPLIGGEIGGVLGGTIPYVGRVLGMAGGAISNALSPVKARAAAMLDQAFSPAGPASVQATEAAIVGNPRLAPMDANINLRNIAEGLATLPGKPREIINEAVSQRANSAPSAVRGVFDSALGSQPDVEALLSGMKKTASDNARVGFGQALNGANPVDVSPVIAAIDAKLKPGVNAVISNSTNLPKGAVADELANVRAMLTDGKNTLTDATRLHEIQSNLRRDAQTLLNSATGSDRRVGHALMDIRAKLIDAIDPATGGKFKPAQAQYADDMAVQGAFDKGTAILKNSGDEMRPEFWAKAFKEMSAPEQDALRLGARTAIDNAMASARNAARRGEAVAQPEFNRERLKIVLGEKETNRLTKLLKEESEIASNNARLMANSMTQPRKEMADMVRPREISPLLGVESILQTGIGGMSYALGHPGPIMASAGIGALRRGSQIAGRRIDNAANERIAAAISQPGRSGYEEVVNLLAQRAAAQRAAVGVEDASNLLMRGASPQAIPAFQEYGNLLSLPRKPN